MQEFEISGGCLKKYNGHDFNLKVPEGVRVIGEGALRDCRDIEEVTLPEGLERIENEAFQWCANLRRVNAPESLVYVGVDAFAGTPFYRYYNENEVEWIDDFLMLGKCLFKARRNLRRAVIPEGTVTICADAFNERVLLAEVEISFSAQEGLLQSRERRRRQALRNRPRLGRPLGDDIPLRGERP